MPTPALGRHNILLVRPMTAKPAFPKTPIRFILFFLKPYMRHFGGLLFIALIWAADTSLEPYLIKLILDILEKTPSHQANLLHHLGEPVIWYISLRLLMNVVGRIHDYISLKVMPHFNKNIVIRITKYVQKHSHSYFQNHFGGSIVSKISTAADTAEAILNQVIYDFIFPFFTLCLIAFTMGTVRPFLAIILIVWTVLFIAVSYLMSFKVQALSEQLSEKYTTLVGKLIDSVTNILAVRLFARRKHEIRFLESTAQEKAEKAEELRWNDLKRSAVMEIMANVLIGVLIYYLIMERQKGNISIGDFALVLTLSLSIIDIIWDISRNYIRFIEDIGKCTQALRTIIVPHEIKDSPAAVPLIIREGEIEFKDVCFGFEKGKHLFNGLCVKIKGNEKVGVVGLSGSGKTTFVNLIVRLMDIQNGAILIDGQDIKDITQDSLHHNVSFIPQEPLLFHRTLMENIRYGKLEASESEVMEAARKAYADVFINAMPQGYHTEIGERGSKLSGGQRQRLAIARAILKGAKILILDEATSALDSETEHHIQQSLDALMQDKTVLVVAHRLSTLLKMDRIIVFGEGKIVEEGNHETLLRKGGSYANFWNMQVNHSRPT